MTVTVLLSVRGAPGVTTTAVALGAVWPDDVRLVEADPAGGVLAVRYRLPPSGGLAGLAAAARRALEPAILDEHSHLLPGGLPVLTAPASSEHAVASLAALAGRLPMLLAQDECDVVVDAGRFLPSGPTRDVVEAADVVAVVARPDAEGLAAAHLACRWLDRSVAGVVRVVVVGERPYPQEEAAAVLGRPVTVVADDARAAAALAGGGNLRALRRSGLIRSTRALVADLAATRQRTAAADGADSPVTATAARREGDA